MVVDGLRAGVFFAVDVSFIEASVELSREAAVVVASFTGFVVAVRGVGDDVLLGLRASVVDALGIPSVSILPLSPSEDGIVEEVLMGGI